MKWSPTPQASVGGRKQTAWSVDDPGYAGTLVDTVPSNAYDLTADGPDGCRIFLLASLFFAAPSVEWQGLVLVLFATMLAAARVPRARVGRTARETKQTPTGFAAAHCTSAFNKRHPGRQRHRGGGRGPDDGARQNAQRPQVVQGRCGRPVCPSTNAYAVRKWFNFARENKKS